MYYAVEASRDLIGGSAKACEFVCLKHVNIRLGKLFVLLCFNVELFSISLFDFPMAAYIYIVHNFQTVELLALYAGLFDTIVLVVPSST